MILYMVAAMSLLLSIDKAAAFMTIIIPVCFFILTFMGIFTVLRRICDISGSL